MQEIKTIDETINDITESVENVSPVVVVEKKLNLPFGYIAIKNKNSGEVIGVKESTFGTTYKTDKWEQLTESKKK